MGIDIYLRWELITEEETEAQYCGFDITKGHLGYLREAYNGDPYPSKILMPESFESGGEPVYIPASTLVERLPATVKAAIERETTVYKGEGVDANTPSVQSYIDFVLKAVRLEAEGHKPMIINSH